MSKPLWSRPSEDEPTAVSEEPMSTDTDTVILEPVTESDLAGALAAAAPRRWSNRATIVLGGLVLVIGGFIGGAYAQQQWGTASATPAAGSGRGQFAGGQFSGGGTGAFPGTGGAQPTAAAGAAANATSGTVKLVDGTTLYVQKADGSVVTVRTNGSTKVSKAQAGKLTDLKAGQKVTVAGGAAADGTVTATTVTTP
jgi:hypothetical protein